MSAADEPGWFLAEQPTGLIGQLDDGIRVLLVDSWYGQQTNRPGIVASAGPSREVARKQAEAQYGKAAVQSVLRIRDALNLTPTGEVRAYLCHAMCELGSTDLEDQLVEVRLWLEAHPREVVTFFIQDLVTPADTADLVERAGLMPFVHEQAVGQRWPTLGEMIASGRRLVFLMENQGGGQAYPWLHDGEVWVQDTPYENPQRDRPVLPAGARICRSPDPVGQPLARRVPNARL